MQPSALLDWYQQHHRDLPWREKPTKTADPYAVLVSELMCQQTRVQTVIPYFERWMKRWPTLADLAAATDDEVRQLWTGLGYYRRAKNLLLTAQVVVAQHGGALPADHAALLALPGIGPYTAGAIASIAFGLPTPLVDGNVGRVFARWHAIETDVTSGAGKRAVWTHAHDWLAHDLTRRDPGTWNQALMELGATVCTPRKPACLLCPVADDCTARKRGLELKLPIARVRTKPTVVPASYLVVLSEHRVLLAKRPENGRWSGLWEPLGHEGDGCVQALATTENLLALPPTKPSGRVVHVLTHRRYEVAVHHHQVNAALLSEPLSQATIEKALASNTNGYVASRWFSVDEALGRRSGVSRLGQKVIEATVS